MKSTKSVTGSGCRTKGHAGEREICSLLSGALNLSDPLERNVDQVRNGGADIIGLRPFAIEVKRQERITLTAWKKQAIAQTTEDNYVAVLMYRQNRQPWRVLMDARYITKKRYTPRGQGVWVEIDMDFFVEIARKRRI